MQGGRVCATRSELRHEATRSCTRFATGFDRRIAPGASKTVLAACPRQVQHWSRLGRPPKNMRLNARSLALLAAILLCTAASAAAGGDRQRLHAAGLAAAGAPAMAAAASGSVLQRRLLDDGACCGMHEEG